MYNCERAPAAIKGFIEKGKDNHPKHVEVTDIVDFACGTNHTVSNHTLVLLALAVRYFISFQKSKANNRKLRRRNFKNKNFQNDGYKFDLHLRVELKAITY